MPPAAKSPKKGEQSPLPGGPDQKMKKNGPPAAIKAPGNDKDKKNQKIADLKIATSAGKRVTNPDQLKPQGGGKKRGKGGSGPKRDKKKAKKKSGKKKGCIMSLFAAFGIGVATITLSDPRAIEAAQMLDLTQKHLRLLKFSFDYIDLDGSGNIDASEFLESLGEQRSPFTDKLFAVIDVDGSGSIEFDEYVRVLATYCMFTKDDILRFCFECFDVDGSGTIDEKEFVELCKTVNNANPTFPANFKTALQEFDVNEDGLIDYSEFLEIERRYPLVLFPAFRLQDTMQKLSMGEGVWLELISDYSENKRIEEYKATHGGRAPPEPFMKTMGKLFFPCMYKTKTYSKLS
jgi:Ca2+-binding EF-hand superfamily protein